VTIFKGNFSSIKEIKFVETDPVLCAKQDPNMKEGQREGTNEQGQLWTESWKLDEITKW
jgi:hypothetical protein